MVALIQSVHVVGLSNLTGSFAFYHTYFLVKCDYNFLELNIATLYSEILFNMEPRCAVLGYLANEFCIEQCTC